MAFAGGQHGHWEKDVRQLVHGHLVLLFPTVTLIIFTLLSYVSESPSFFLVPPRLTYPCYRLSASWPLSSHLAVQLLFSHQVMSKCTATVDCSTPDLYVPHCLRSLPKFRPAVQHGIQAARQACAHPAHRAPLHQALWSSGRLYQFYERLDGKPQRSSDEDIALMGSTAYLCTWDQCLAVAAS